ncbi:MAG: nicotinate (nicotinamide) nucleotide adenylyltransferase [bacterium]|nr:nicotinate (nicotinamide) nucleotide adenylyltransferase [bacterium]
MTTTRSIGILGGTFNPIHLAHLIIAETVREHYHPQKVLFIPSARPPHKTDPDIIPAVHRAELVRLAITDNPFFEFSDIEVKRRGRSYSVETLRALRAPGRSQAHGGPQDPRHSGACPAREPERAGGDAQPTDYFFIIGSDSVPELRTWKNIEELAHLCTFVVVPRPGWELDRIVGTDLGLPDWLTQSVLSHIVHAPLVAISSTEIRDRIRAGKSIRYLVPGAVEEYILVHNLYRTPVSNTR